MKEQIAQVMAGFLNETLANRLPDIDEKYYDTPIVRVADVNDPLFAEYKTVIGDFHFTPRQIFEDVYGLNSLLQGSVVSLVLPVSEYVRQSNRRKDQSSREWAWLRSFADEALIEETAKHLSQYLGLFGGKSVIPILHGSYRKMMTPTGPVSNWSERHAAFVAGHGTFSLNDGFITERGIAVRFVSVITDLKLTPDKRTAIRHHENCLFCSVGKCGACMKRCPVGAITKDGHDKMKCAAYTYGEASKQRAVEYGGIYQFGAGCGLCQVAVPCEYKAPVL